jgi:hypothetical protein
VTSGTQSDEILFGIIAGSTAKFFMVDLQLLKAAAVLTPPTIPSQDFSTELPVGFRIEA